MSGNVKIIDFKEANLMDKPPVGKATHCIIQTDVRADFDHYAAQIINNSQRQKNPVEKMDLGLIYNLDISMLFRMIAEASQRTANGTMIVYNIDKVSPDIQHRFKQLIESGEENYRGEDKFRGRFLFWSRDNTKVYDGLLTWITLAFFPDKEVRNQQ